MSRILVIDDDVALLETVRELLMDSGYEVEVSEIVRPLPYVEEIAPDLIILDYIFDGEPQGWELLQRLKMKDTTARIPVIVCTGASEALHRIERSFFRQGVEVVLKPFMIDTLLHTVQSMLPPDMEHVLA